LNAVVLKDATAALQLAQRDGDELGAICWQAVIDRKKVQPEDTIEISGVLSSYQAARNLRRKVGDGVPEDLLRGCSPMLEDSKNFLRKFAVVVGLKGAAGFLGGPLGGILR
jgi:hypothetical protein